MDTKKIDDCLLVFDKIRKALETLQIVSTRNNLNVALGCIQLCDLGIKDLTAVKDTIVKKEGQTDG